MATYIPSELSRSLERAGQNFLQVMLDEARRRQQQEQFEERMSLEERRLESSQDAQTKSQALQTISLFTPFLQGQRVADVPFIHDTVGTLFPEFDPADETSLGAMSFGDPTFQQYLDQRKIEAYESLPDDLKQTIDERALLGTSIEGLEFEETLLEVQRSHLDQILSDPEQVGKLGQQLFGLPQRVNARLPDGQGGVLDISWDSEAEARLSVSIWQTLQAQQAAGVEATTSQLTDMAKDLKKIAEDQGYGIPLHMARTIVRTVHSGEEGAVEELMNQLIASGSEAGVAALEMYMRGSQLGETLEEGFMRQFPALGLYVSIASQIESALGKQAAADLMPSIARQMHKAGINIARDPGWLRRFNIGERALQSEEMPVGGGVGGGGGGGGFGAPDMSPEEQLEAAGNMMREDAQLYANGEISLKALVDKYGREGANVVVAQSRTLGGGT